MCSAYLHQASSGLQTHELRNSLRLRRGTVQFKVCLDVSFDAVLISSNERAHILAVRKQQAINQMPVDKQGA